MNLNIVLSITSFKDVFQAIFILAIVYLLVRWYNYYQLKITIPEILEKYGFNESTYKEEDLKSNKRFNEFKPLKYRGKIYYLAQKPYKLGLIWAGIYNEEYLNQREKNAFNYLQRMRFPIDLSNIS